MNSKYKASLSRMISTRRDFIKWIDTFISTADKLILDEYYGELEKNERAQIIREPYLISFGEQISQFYTCKNLTMNLEDAKKRFIFLLRNNRMLIKKLELLQKMEQNLADPLYLKNKQVNELKDKSVSSGDSKSIIDSTNKNYGESLTNTHAVDKILSDSEGVSGSTPQIGDRTTTVVEKYITPGMKNEHCRVDYKPTDDTEYLKKKRGEEDLVVVQEDEVPKKPCSDNIQPPINCNNEESDAAYISYSRNIQAAKQSNENNSSSIAKYASESDSTSKSNSRNTGASMRIAKNTTTLENENLLALENTKLTDPISLCRTNIYKCFKQIFSGAPILPFD